MPISFHSPRACLRPHLLFLYALAGGTLAGEEATASPAPPSDPEAVELPPVVVVASGAASPFEALIDPKAPAQPLPAQDGADVLKSIPGFSVIRKGGTDGDPVLRGMAGSRIGIQAEGQVVLGGCGSRMDPPTAYISPAAYDRVRVLKGPQTVLHGPGQSAGLVLFENAPPGFTRREATLRAAMTMGSWGRFDLAADGTVGDEERFARLNLTRTRSGNYEDGDGRTVHSHHLRWSAHATLGWTPDRDTLLQLSAITSDGEAAYADRLMDGVRFDRRSVSLRARRDRVSPLIAGVELEIGLNDIDHVMDNYSLRPFTPSMMMRHPTVSNPDRLTRLARLRLELTPDPAWDLALGLDHQSDRHRLRRTMNQLEMPFEAMERMKDATFSQIGAFGEATCALDEKRRLVAGLRLDRWSATDHRQAVRLGMMGSRPNPTAGERRDALLPSGFLRYERDLANGSGSVFAGIGHVARFLDYWELIKNEAPESLSAFHRDPERTTQLDLGLSRQLGTDLQVTLAAFYSRVNDFALVQNDFPKPSGVADARRAVVTRGIQARTWGGEAVAVWRALEHWRIDASLAWTRGENTTDGLPLAQIPPLEARLGATYTRATWSFGALLRAVGEQDRVAIGQGNIVGQDIGPTEGFSTLALHASWAPAPSVRFSTGVDNLCDTTYAEHLSRSGAAVAGYPQTTRVNEPGRTLWARLDLRF